MIITLVTQKGGTGKTTLLTSLAVVAMESGQSVAAFDLDPQGSLANWGDTRTAADPHVERFPAAQVSQLVSLVRTVEKQFPIIFLDTAGADSVVTHKAMEAADLCLVPVRPTRIDVSAIKPTYQTLTLLDKPFAFVLNQCPTMPKNNRAFEVKDGLTTIANVALPMIGQRVDYQDAYAAGEGVTETAPDGKAAEEVRALWQWILKFQAKMSKESIAA